MKPDLIAFKRAMGLALADPRCLSWRTIRDAETGQTWSSTTRNQTELRFEEDFVGVIAKHQPEAFARAWNHCRAHKPLAVTLGLLWDPETGLVWNNLGREPFDIDSIKDACSLTLDQAAFDRLVETVERTRAGLRTVLFTIQLQQSPMDVLADALLSADPFLDPGTIRCPASRESFERAIFDAISEPKCPPFRIRDPKEGHTWEVPSSGWGKFDRHEHYIGITEPTISITISPEKFEP